MTKQAGIVLVLREDGKILVVSNRRYGGWCLPGGKVEEGETPLAAAVRELREETGCYADRLTFLCVGESATEGGRQVSMYLARSIYHEPRNVEDGTEIGWMSLEELMQSEPFGPYYRRHLAEGVDHLKPTLIFRDVG